MDNSVRTYKVSVIIATYNTAEYIEECLDSIFAQTLRPIEVFVIDDGSTDNTAEILERYKKSYNYLKVLYQENAGQAISINRAMALVNGEYIAFMDPDDKYPRDDCLEVLYTAAIDNNACLCGGNMLQYNNGEISSFYTAGDGDSKHSKNCYIDASDYYNWGCHTRYLYQTKMMIQNGVKHGLYQRFGDQIMFLRALIVAKKVYEVDYPVYWYRIRHGRNFDEHVWLDVLKAIRDTYAFMVEHNMELMYKKNSPKLSEYKKEIFDLWHYSKEFESVIDDIQFIQVKSSWSTNNELIKVQLEQIKKETVFFERLLKTGFPIIIYGAGHNTKVLLDRRPDCIGQVIGIAVTNQSNEKRINGIEIKPINDFADYKDNAIILVTPSKLSGKEMYNYAVDLGFKNVEHIDVSNLYKK